MYIDSIVSVSETEERMRRMKAEEAQMQLLFYGRSIGTTGIRCPFLHYRNWEQR